MVQGSDVPAESNFDGVVNPPDADWVELYTRDGRPRRVPPEDVQEALNDGLLQVRYDLDQAVAECVASHLGAADAVAKAVAEMKATGGQRDEDSWIISEALAKARDAGTLLQYALGALIPTEGFIASLKEHEAVHGVGGSPEFNRVQALLVKHRAAVDALPDDRLVFHQKRAAADEAARGGN